LKKDRQCDDQRKKEQKDKQWSTKLYIEHIWATRTPLKSEDLFIQQLRFDLCFYDVMIEVYNSSVVLLVFHFITLVRFVIL
jgi:hypothetical protein